METPNSDREAKQKKVLLIPGLGAVPLYGEATISDEISGETETLEGEDNGNSTTVTRNADGSISMRIAVELTEGWTEGSREVFVYQFGYGAGLSLAELEVQ